MSELTLELEQLDAQVLDALLQGRLQDPFSVLGPHIIDGRCSVRSFQPGAQSVELVAPQQPDGAVLETLSQQDHGGLFVGSGSGLQAGQKYLLKVTWPDGRGGTTIQLTEDVYGFGPLLGELDLYLLAQGNHRELGRCLGAVPMTLDGVAGTRFAVWAPNARRVSVVGDFNHWDGRRHPMRLRHEAHVWELFIPRLPAGSCYQYEILGADGTLLPLKADPVARATAMPPSTLSVVANDTAFDWHDADWLNSRAARHAPSAPLSVYEVHAASWLRILEDGNRNLNWHELGERLIPYALQMGFTHLEFLPVMEHPFGGSWGYQPLGLFAPSARFGAPAAFAAFVDRCHTSGLGVILDWVPAHFPSDPHGLAQFDGTALYEHQDPREGFHRDWNTLIYNLGRNEVAGFLIASALEWIEHYHVDGLRVDAVASMLYRDYSREHGEWIPNVHGGRENLEAVAFLRKLNQVIAERCPGAMMIAEESTAWPGVSADLAHGGLGFNYKWNMGWMHDTLRYFSCDPLYRKHHHHDMTFGMIYAFSEKFVLPISHDEVVHGKGALLAKMAGADLQQKLANLRAYFAFMWTHPGKKLLFMGCEFGQTSEWNHDASPTWDLLDDPRHRGVQRLVRDLNRLYVGSAALHQQDCEAGGFSWVIGDDSDNSVFAYLRSSRDPQQTPLLVVLNLTPMTRHAYRIGVPAGALWEEVLNTDAACYGGSNQGNGTHIAAAAQASHGHAQSLVLTLPGLSAIVLRQKSLTRGSAHE